MESGIWAVSPYRNYVLARDGSILTLDVVGETGHMVKVDEINLDDTEALSNPVISDSGRMVAFVMLTVPGGVLVYVKSSIWTSWCVPLKIPMCDIYATRHNELWCNHHHSHRHLYRVMIVGSDARMRAGSWIKGHYMGVACFHPAVHRFIMHEYGSWHVLWMTSSAELVTSVNRERNIFGLNSFSRFLLDGTCLVTDLVNGGMSIYSWPDVTTDPQFVINFPVRQHGTDIFDVAHNWMLLRCAKMWLNTETGITSPGPEDVSQFKILLSPYLVQCSQTNTTASSNQGFFDSKSLCMMVFKRLGIQDLMICGQVCRTWRTLVKHENLWFRACVSTWGRPITALKRLAHNTGCTWRDFCVGRVLWLNKWALICMTSGEGMSIRQIRIPSNK